MPTFSDYVPKDNIESEKAKVLVTKNKLDFTSLDHQRAAITAQSALNSLDFSSLSNLENSLRAPEGERFFGSVSRIAEQTRRAVPENIPLVSQLVRGALGAVRDITSPLEQAAQGMQAAQGPTDYLGSLASGTLSSTLGVPSAIGTNLTREVLGEDRAKQQLFSLPVIGGVSAEDLAGGAASFAVPATALERGVGNLIGRGLGATGRRISDVASNITSKEALGAAIGGTTGVLTTPTDEQGNRPIGESLLRGAEGAVLGAAAPRLYQDTLRRAADTTLGIVYQPVAGNALTKYSSSFRDKGERVTEDALDKVFLSFKSDFLSFFDRYSNINQFENWAIKELQKKFPGMDPNFSMYTKARLYAGRGIEATQYLKDRVQPITRDLTEEQTGWLDGYLALRNANEQALMIAEREQNNFVKNNLSKIVRKDPAIIAAKKTDPLIKDALSSPEKFIAFGNSSPLALKLFPKLEKLHKDAVDKAQDVVSNRQFGSIMVNGTLEPLRAVDPVKIEADLDALAGNQAQLIRDKAKQVYAVVDDLRDRMHSSGLISDETLDLFRKKYPNYIPIDIIDYVENVASKVGGESQKFSVPNIIDSISVKGSEYNRDNPLNSIIGMVYKVNSASGRNGIGQSLLEIRDSIPMLQDIIREIKRGSEPPTPTDVLFDVYKEGKKLTFAVDRSYRSLVEFDQDSLSNWMRVARAVTGAPVLVAGATRFNPKFVALNAIRDARTFLLRNAAEGKDIRETWQQLYAAYKDTFRDILPERFGGGTAADLAELRRQGVAGENLFRETTTNNQVRRLLNGDSPLSVSVERLRNAEDFAGKILAAMDVVGSAVSIPFRPISAISEAVEAAPRLAQFRMTGDALAAREITMDFDRAGNLARTLNMFVPFFNVGVQGTERFVRRDVMNALQNPKTAAAAYMSYAIAPALAAEAYNRSHFPNEYANVPNYLKESGQVFVLSAGETKPDGTKGDPKYLYLPIPQELKFLQTVVVNAVDYALKYAPDNSLFKLLGMKNPEKGPPRSWVDIGKTILGQITPVSLEDPSYISSPLGRTAMGVAVNRDFYRDVPIVPDPLRTLPPEEQVRPWNTALSRALGNAFKVSPAKIEFAINSMLGGTGASMLEGTDVVAKELGLQGSQQPSNAPPETFRQNVFNFGTKSIFGGIYRDRGQQVNQSTRDEVQAAIPNIVRNALANLRADPQYKKYTPEQQAEESRRLSVAVERMVLEAQDPQIFEAPPSSGKYFKYLNSKSANDDRLYEDAVQAFRAWQRDPTSRPPTNEEFRRAILATENPLYKYEQEDLKERRDAALASVSRTVPDYSRR